MRTHLFLLIIILTISCTKESKNENVALIKGKLLSGNVKNVRFEYIVDNPITGYGETYVAKVDSNAGFSIEIPIDRLATGKIKAGEFRHEICLIPGDDIFITIDGDSITYEGQGAEKNSFLYHTELEDIWGRGFFNEYQEGKLAPEEFLKKIQGLKQQSLNTLLKFSNRTPLDPAFVNYYEINNEVIYETFLQGYSKNYSRKNGIPTDSLQLLPEYIRLKNLSGFVNDEKIISNEYIRNLKNFLILIKAGKL